MKTALLPLFFVTTFVSPLVNPSHGAEVYRFAQEIPIGGEGGWDCLTVDSIAQRLYVSHGTKFVVIDLAKNAVVGEIADTPGAHDFAVAPEAGKGFTTNGRENKSSVVDLKTLQTVSKIETGENPDIIIYEPSQKEVWCFNAKGNSVTVISAATTQVVATIALPGNPEFAVCDPAAAKVYCNIESKSTVAVLDAKTHTLVTTWPIAPGESASGLAVDLEHHRLFLGCDNELMVMLDSTNGKVVGTVPIGKRIDGAAFDPGTQMAFASSGEGKTTISHEDSPDKLTVVQTLETKPGARTMTVDPATHRIYLVAAETEPEAPATAGGERHWPKIIAGTQKVLVYEPAKLADETKTALQGPVAN